MERSSPSTAFASGTLWRCAMWTSQITSYKARRELTKKIPFLRFAYGIVTLPLVHDIPTVHPRFTHPWYRYDTIVGGKFDTCHEHMRDILVRVPPQGYFLEPNKRILVVSPWNVHRKEAHFKDKGVHMVTRNRYIGDQESEKEYLAEKLTG